MDRLIVDCSVVVKWRMTAEPHAAQALELLLDWRYQAVAACAPTFLLLELTSALLRAQRQNRITEAESHQAVAGLLGLPYDLLELAPPIVSRAYEIAHRHTQKVYDCAYVALAEHHGIELWTGDERLFNALGAHFPLLRWVGNYSRRRP